MNNFNKITIQTIFFIFIISCGKKIETLPPHKIKKIDSESKKLNNYFDKIFDEYVDRHPEYQSYLGIKKDYDKWDDISSNAEEIELAQATNSLQWLKDSINIKFLDSQTLLSYELFKQKLENQIYDHKYYLYSYPVNQMSGKQSGVPAFLINMHKITSKKDAQDYISRLVGINPLFQQLFKNLKQREDIGIVPPTFILDHVLNDSKNVISGFPFSGDDSCALFLDFHSKIMDLDIAELEKNNLLILSKQALIGSVKPAYDQLINLVNDLKSNHDEADGVWRWKDGDEYYKNALNRTTTTQMTAEEIHSLGLKEVKRIHKEMTSIMDKEGFNGTLKDFFIELKENNKYYFPQSKKGKEDYIIEAKEIIETFSLSLDDLFITKPQAEMVVKPVEQFREKSAGKAFYQRPAPDGSRPGTYYANTYKMKMMPKYQMEALAYHEGIPGHHMQISIAQELEGLPKFRKYGGYTSYTEGWGLYSEYLPKELGFYSDPYSDFGRLAMELWRSCRLVVDTGIHSKKWTREESIQYYLNNTPNDELDCIKMVERHIVYPSQATAYKVGMNKILYIREKAKESLGNKFDIRYFHEIVLSNGAVPLNILERQIDEMIMNTLNK